MQASLIQPAEPLAAPGRDTLLLLLAALFGLSGAAGLIYEIVWFQILQLIIGGTSQSLGVLLACFMGGLFLGSLASVRMLSPRRNPLRVYALLELGIGLCGLAVPPAAAAIREYYLTHAQSPERAMLLRCLISALLLVPPTLLMGATLPVLARCLRADERQAARTGWLYAANIVGAVVGIFAAVLVLLPWLGLAGTNHVAVAINVVVAVIAAWQARVAGRALEPVSEGEPAAESAPLTLKPGLGRPLLPPLLVFLAYALNGASSLSLEVLWSRLLSVSYGATTYAFGFVLGTFLVGLSLGSAVGSRLVSRIDDPRRLFMLVQLGVVVFVGSTSAVIPWAAAALADTELGVITGVASLSLVTFIRTALVVLPATILWGMSFPLALACLGLTGRRDDPARLVGPLYAFNTLGAVIGSLATSFILNPRYGSADAAAHLVWLPVLAAGVLAWPRRWSPILALPLVAAIGFLVYSPLPSRLAEALRAALPASGGRTVVWLCALILPAAGAIVAWRRRTGVPLVLGGAAMSVFLAFATSVPAVFYQLGRDFAYSADDLPPEENIVLFVEGVNEPAVVYRNQAGALELSVIGQVCASTGPGELSHLRLLGHLPVMLSADPAQTLVVGLGAGVTAGSAAIHDRVERVWVAELEPEMRRAAAQFAAVNHGAMHSPKVTVIIDDGRHYIATSQRRFGVITSDPIEPFWMGSAALYTTEYYRLCREHLIPGGTFMQWLGVFGIDQEGIRSLVSSFAEIFPQGQIWTAQNELLLLGANGPLILEVPALRTYLDEYPAVARSLVDVDIDSVEDLLAHFHCPVAALKDDLAGAVPNRDANLYSQYAGWRPYHLFTLPRVDTLFPTDACTQAAREAIRVPASQAAEFEEDLRQARRKFQRQP